MDTAGQAAIILTDMATKYRRASEHLKDVREGLTLAVQDAKLSGLDTAQIMTITGWSRTQVKKVTRPEVTLTDQAETPSVQAEQDGGQ